MKRTSIRRLTVSAVLLASATAAQGQDRTATGFFYPRSQALGTYAGFLDASCGNEKKYISDLFHLGKDSAGSLGTTVYAIADGEVVYVSLRGWIYGDLTGSMAGDGISSNVGLLIKHRTSQGFWFQAMYGHILTTLKTGEKVYAGKPLGTIGSYGGMEHVHFGLRIPINKDASDLPSHFGLARCSEWPLGAEDRWIDPIQFITTRTPDNYLGSGSTGALVPFIGDVNPKIVPVGVDSTFTLKGSGFQAGFSGVLWVGGNSFPLNPGAQTNFQDLNTVQLIVKVGGPSSSTTSFCLQVINPGGAASNQFCGLTAQAASQTAGLQVTFNPNPTFVTNVSDCSDSTGTGYQFTLIIKETQGVGITPSGLSLDGDSSWPGPSGFSQYIGPRGSNQFALTWCRGAGSSTWAVTAIDDNGHTVTGSAVLNMQ